jgi:hypothetical protein
MRREMQQLAALAEAAAGEAWTAASAPPWLEDRVVRRVILGPSWNALPVLAPLLLGAGVGGSAGWPHPSAQ